MALKISGKQSKINVDLKNSTINDTHKKEIEQVQPSSKLTMEKVFQKSKIKIEDSYDPKTLYLFKNCMAELVNIQIKTTEHNEYVRKDDYFELSE